MRSTLRVLLIGGPMYDSLYERLPIFERHEGVPVEVAARLIHSRLNERIDKEFRSGAARYDVISTHTKYAPSQRQWLTPLDQDLTAAELAAFDPVPLDLARIDGHLCGVPRNLDVKLLHYRTDLITRPPVSWDELADRAIAATTATHAGFVFPGRGSGLFGHFFELTAMAGGQMFPDQARPIPHVRTDAGRWALELLRTLFTRAAPRDVVDWEFDRTAACFRDGRAAMTTDWPGSFHTYEEPGQSAVVGRYDLSLYPEGTAGRHVYAGCHTFAIPRTVRDRPAAVALLRFLTSQESQALEASSGTLPARRDALHEIRKQSTPGSRASRRWDLLEQTVGCAIVPPRHPNFPAVEEVIWQSVRRCLLGELDVETTLDTIERSGGAAATETLTPSLSRKRRLRGAWKLN